MAELIETRGRRRKMKIYEVEGQDMYFTTRELAEEYVRVKQIMIDQGDIPETLAEVYEIEVLDRLPEKRAYYRMNATLVKTSRPEDVKRIVLNDLIEKECYEEDLNLNNAYVNRVLNWKNGRKRGGYIEEGAAGRYYYKEITEWWSEKYLSLEEAAKALLDLCAENKLDTIYLGNYNDTMRKIVNIIQSKVRCIKE